MGAVAAVRCLNRLLFGTPMRAAQQQQQRPAVAPQLHRHQHLQPTLPQQQQQPAAMGEAPRQRSAGQLDEGDAGQQAAGAAEGAEQQRRDDERRQAGGESADGAGTSGSESREGPGDAEDGALQAQQFHDGRSAQAEGREQQQQQWQRPQEGQEQRQQQAAAATVTPPADDGDEGEDPECLYLDGNREDYFNPRNSYINDVLDSRRGIPIRHVAHRCGAVEERLR